MVIGRELFMFTAEGGLLTDDGNTARICVHLFFMLAAGESLGVDSGF